MFNLNHLLSKFPEGIIEAYFYINNEFRYSGFVKRVKKELRQSGNKEYINYADSLNVLKFGDRYNTNWGRKYKHFSIKIQYDYDCPFYLYQRKYKMYLPNDWSKSKCKRYIRSILEEQDCESPHCYLENNLLSRISKGTVLDIGTAEGNFGLDVLDSSSKLYLFECDNDFCGTLRHTFEHSMKDGKVVLVSKYVTDKSKDGCISIDDYFCDDMPRDVSLIKMDIEGAEQKALKGMKKLLELNPQAILLICIYHTQSAETEIREILHDYDIHVRKGYFLLPEFGEQKYPYIRHAVLEARKKEDNH